MSHDERALAPAAQQKKDLVKSARDFLGNAFGGKNTDLSQAIEDFTSEMTLVAEGLSEDQARLSRQGDLLSAQQTQLEEEMLQKFHDLDADMQALSQRLDQLESSLDKLQHAREKQLRKSDGLHAILRQATWLVSIAAGAWIVTSIIRLFQ